jgi:hypothetical protein
MTNEEIIEVLDDMKVKIRVPEAAVTQLKRNAALDEAIKRFKEPHIKVLERTEVVLTMGPADFYTTAFWDRVVRSLEIMGFAVCKVENPEPNENEAEYGGGQ